MLKNLRRVKSTQVNNDQIKKAIGLMSCAMLAYSVMLCPPVFSQQIIPDGKTQTTLGVNGNVTNVNTSTVQGQNAFNSFSRFNVDAGNVVNLNVPDSASRLINIVHNEASNINGVLNALKGGAVGGNIYLVNPNGIFVGSQGVINVGSLTAITPTKQFTDNFFSAPGSPDGASVSALLNGTAPINPNAVVNIQGKVNAINDVNIQAGTINHSGEIYTGAVFKENDITMGDVVNVNTLESGANIAVNNGVVTIKAENDIVSSGKIVADGGNNIDGGKISLVAGHNVVQNEGSLLSAKGKGENSNGGTIYTWGDNANLFKAGSTMDARGAEVSGNGGFIDLSTKGGMIFDGEILLGNGGKLLIDPKNITIISGTGSTPITSYDGFGDYQDQSVNLKNTDIETRLNDGYSVTLQANNDITVNSDAPISVSSGGNGQSLTLQAGRDIIINADIATYNGNFTAQANDPDAVDAQRSDPTTTTGNITLGSGVDINAGTADITLRVMNGDGLPGSITGTTTSTLTAKNITLNVEEGTGTIGSSTSNYLRVNTDAGNNGTLTASTTNGAMYIEEISQTNGDLKVNSVNAGTGDVYIKAYGNITDGTGTDPSIIGKNITLTHPSGSTGSIGTTDNPLNINSDASNGGVLYAVTYNGLINITETEGDLKVYAVDAGEYYLSGGYDVKLTAAGSILRGRDNYNVYGKNITLIANNGTIGETNTPILTDLNYRGTTGVLTATTSTSNESGHINIQEYNSDLKIDHIVADAGKANVKLSVYGSMSDNHSGSFYNIYAKDIILESTYDASTGKIGDISSNKPILVDMHYATTPGTLTAKTYDGNIYIYNYYNPMKIDLINANNDSDGVIGNVKIVNGPYGSITDGTGTDPSIIGNNITLTAGNLGNIGSEANYIKTDSSSLTVTASIGSIYLKELGSTALISFC